MAIVYIIAYIGAKIYLQKQESLLTQESQRGYNTYRTDMKGDDYGLGVKGSDPIL